MKKPRTTITKFAYSAALRERFPHIYVHETPGYMWTPKIKHACSKHKIEFFVPPAQVLGSKTGCCPQCATSARRVTLGMKSTEIKRRLKANNPQVMLKALLHSNCTVPQKKAEFKCRLCRDVWIANIDNVVNKAVGCPKCGKRKAAAATSTALTVYTFDVCAAEAKKYRDYYTFKNKAPRTFEHARRKGWLLQVTEHMSAAIAGPGIERYVYVITFADKTCYVGLSFNVEYRLSLHRASESSAGRRMNEEPYTVKVYGPYSETEASALECKKIANYKRRGFTVLNKAKGGALGGNMLAYLRRMQHQQSGAKAS